MDDKNIGNDPKQGGNYMQTQYNIHSPGQNGNPMLDSTSQVQIQQQLSGGQGRMRWSQTEIKQVQGLVEKSLRHYLSRDETVTELHIRNKIDPVLVSAVWQKLSEQNPEFFEAYEKRVRVK